MLESRIKIKTKLKSYYFLTLDSNILIPLFTKLLNFLKFKEIF